MKKIKGIALLSILVIFQSVFAYSQWQDKPLEEQLKRIKEIPLSGFFGISATNSVPQNQFQDYLQKSGFGLSLFGGYYADPIPFAAGFNADLIFFGGETKRFKYQKPGGWTIGEDTVTTSSLIVPLSVFVRIKPIFFNTFMPYLEGFAGYTILNVSADYKPYWGKSDSKNKTSFAFHYGASAGLMIELVDFIDLPSSHRTMCLDVRLKYIKGNEADYATAKILDDTTVEFRDFRSKTDMLLLLLGLTFRF
ncbi:MAG: hypothetical protein N2319_05665 [Candidatus Kapabacteria bacterium]|nr:hypothetical protein [Candidatus Kapabacteria bacterium]